MESAMLALTWALFVLTLVLVAFAIVTWHADHNFHHWREARRGLLLWNQRVLMVAENLLADSAALHRVVSEPVFDAGLRIYARHEAILDEGTLFRDPVFRLPAHGKYEFGLMTSIRDEVAFLSNQWPLATGTRPNDAPLTSTLLDNRLKHLRERCGVYDRFVRELSTPSRLRIAKVLLFEPRKVRKFRSQSKAMNDSSTRMQKESRDQGFWLG